MLPFQSSGEVPGLDPLLSECIPKFGHVSAIWWMCSTGLPSNRGSRSRSLLWSADPCLLWPIFEISAALSWVHQVITFSALLSRGGVCSFSCTVAKHNHNHAFSVLLPSLWNGYLCLFPRIHSYWFFVHQKTVLFSLAGIRSTPE